MKKIVWLLAVMMVCCVASTASAFPEKKITYQVPFSPGGQSDLEARRQQPLLEKLLGVDVVVEYRPGGGGSLGWTELIQQKPDGYYMASINLPHIILQPLARGNAGYATEDMKTLAIFQTTPLGLAVLKDSPIKTLEQFVEHAKKHPRTITCGGSGTWSGHHIAYLQLVNHAGVEMIYIPSKGAAQTMADFLGGHVQAAWGSTSDFVRHADKVRVLAFASPEPFNQMPDVPTFESKGYKFNASIDRGVAVPRDTPADVSAVLEKAFMTIANTPEVRQQMEDEGTVPMAMGIEESQAYIDGKAKELKVLVEQYK